MKIPIMHKLVNSEISEWSDSLRTKKKQVNSSKWKTCEGLFILW